MKKYNPKDIEEKWQRKWADARIAETTVDVDVTAPGSGFEVDTNQAVLITPDGTARELPQMPKIQLADAIWDRVAPELKR